MGLKFKAENGFTLIEMIFVVLLLATLTSIVTLTLSGVQTESTRDLTKIDFEVIRSAARSYYLETNRLPSSIGELSDYLDEIPDDKFLNGSETPYTLSLTDGLCTIRSVGPDRRSNTPDDLILTFSP